MSLKTNVSCNDPFFAEFLHGKVVEFTDKEREMEQWIDQTLEKAADGLPTRKDYETRMKVNTLIDCVLSWLNILDRIYILTSLDYLWTKVVVCGNFVPTNNLDNYYTTTEYDS